MEVIRFAISLALQLALVFMVGTAGYPLAAMLRIPIPGNVLAIVLLYALLASRIIRLEWLERGAAMVTGNLVLFIVPLAAGLMTLGGVLSQHGLPIAFVLIVSLVAGLLVTGRIAERAAQS